MSRTNRVLSVVGVVVVALVVIALVGSGDDSGAGTTAAANGPSGSAGAADRSSTSPTRGVPGGGSGASTSTPAGSSPRGSTGGGEPTATSVPVAGRGVVDADPASRYGQSPSNGTCAHWSESFVNRSSVKVVHITFAPGKAFFSKGKPGDRGYREYPAATPEAAEVNTSIAPRRSQQIQFMTCTTTTPPSGIDALHIAPPSVLKWKWADGVEGSDPFP